MSSLRESERVGARRRFVVGLLVFAAAVILVLAGYRIFTVFPQGFLEDDAYFYAKIARNFASTGVVTFDGVHSTDGFHLLWFWILAATSYLTGLFSADRDVHLAAMLVVYFTIGFSVVHRFGRTWFQKGGFFLLLLISTFLMETALLGLLLLLTTELLLRRRSPFRPWHAWPLLLIPLARIDAVLIVGVALTALLFERRMKVYLWSMLLLVVGVGLHLVAMKLTAGSFTSVSSAAKSHTMFAFGANLRSNVFNLRGIIALGLCGLAALSVLGAPDLERRRTHLLIVLGVAAFAAAHLLASPLARSWYFLPVMLVAADIVFRVDHRRSTLVLKTAIVVLAALFVGQKGIYFVRYSAEMENSKRFVARVGAIVPAGELIYQVDGSGYVGYFSERRVVNGDGLVNSHAYFAAWKRNGLKHYLRDHKIHYLIDNRKRRGKALVRYHGLRIDKADVDVLIPPFPSAHPHAHFALYRLRRVSP
jgi:hypothetical protein